MSETPQPAPLPPPETTSNELKTVILQKASRLIRSTQNPPEWPGAQFLKPKKESDSFSRLDTSFKSHLAEYELAQNGGIVVSGTPLEQAVQTHSQDAIAEDDTTAQERGFWAGAKEALDWIGITKDKWSSQTPDICALETLAAAEGIPTSRQSNHMRPESLVGAKVKNVLGVKGFDYGAINGIQRTEDGPLYLRHGKPKVHKQLGEGYRKGVEVAFLHYIGVGEGRVRISQIEQLSQAFQQKK